MKLRSGTPLSGVFNNGRQSDPLLYMMSGGNIQSFSLWGWNEGFLDRIGIIPTTFTVRKFQIWSAENWAKQVPRLISILQACTLLSELILEKIDMDTVADYLMPALERIKPSQALKLDVGREYDFCAVLDVDAHTGKTRSIEYFLSHVLIYSLC